MPHLASVTSADTLAEIEAWQAMILADLMRCLGSPAAAEAVEALATKVAEPASRRKISPFQDGGAERRSTVQ